MKTIVCLFIFIRPLIAQMDANKKYLLEQSLPDVCREILQSSNVSNQYQISDHLNPFYLEADFNGDQKIDAAIVVQEKTNRKIGIMIIHGGSKSYHILGAGKELGNGGDDFAWMDIWKVYRQKQIGKKLKPIVLSGAGIWIEKSESASAIVYWDGKGYRWYQAGD
ncbi:MAG: hypothetical protein IPM92_10000 [Saprospiraceae bacterium]|nr:hypothetical protein [Saprospiraceae bacterium]